MSLKKFSLLLLVLSAVVARGQNQQPIHFYPASHAYFQYTGRIDFSNPLRPRFWSSGVYFKARFKGDYCMIILNDEILYGSYHNYIAVIVDNEQPIRVKMKGKTDSIVIGSPLSKKLSDGSHTIIICKNTEDGIGYLEFVGLRCKKLLALPAKPARSIECIGNSITCGMSSDLSEVPCGKGDWYDQHNAYMSYGMITARSMNAQVHLTAVSGIGLVHSCCNLTITMPAVFDNIDLRNGTRKWNFKNYQPDVVTICLGQNDGIQDSVKFCSAYCRFVERLRENYPKAKIICLTSPMADEKLLVVLKKYLSSVAAFENHRGDNNVYTYFFSKRYHNGCGDHPDVSEHRQMANELVLFIKSITGW
ncbi:MAG TPA: SGNH/GDSL hydrolase family protein [Chitinophagaceae bacterium]|nr:SGNH/GDSL hydrolase family protein [Chitinophagaceae bacterium]